MAPVGSGNRSRVGESQISTLLLRSFEEQARGNLKGQGIQYVDGKAETARFVHRLLPHATHASERAPRWHPT
jgi:hypothetical protein